MNWLVKSLIKQARRRYRANDRIRFFTDRRKGKGQNVVHTPPFAKGTVQDFNPDTRRYVVTDGTGESVEVHPRNIVPDSISRSPDVDGPITNDQI